MDDIKVSVSSRSYILSYFKGECCMNLNEKISFRLLSELYSLLFKEYYCNTLRVTPERFPSPLGVIFSLMNCTRSIEKRTNNSFRLLSELYSLLFIGKISIH